MKKEKNFWVENCENGIDVIANKVESYGIQWYKSGAQQSFVRIRLS